VKHARVAVSDIVQPHLAPYVQVVLAIEHALDCERTALSNELRRGLADDLGAP
jgi:hypothetical protein